jgi:hypothetical protein
MPRSILTHTPSPACLACRRYAQCGAIEASQVRLHPADSHAQDNSRSVPRADNGVFNDEKQIHGQTSVERGGVRSAAQRAAIGVCTDQFRCSGGRVAGSVLYTDRAVGRRCVPAVEVTINAESHFLCSEQHTHAQLAS